MFKKILPWKWIVRSAARRYGVIDPISTMARIRGFAQPSEVAEPFELLRAGIVFHARGLANTKAIQHNLDWVWPYWVERQFNPQDNSFIPRAFSFSHINLTHRNWTTVGHPDHAEYPVVDPRGLFTPLYDGWSVDVWIVHDGDVPNLLPSKSEQASQVLELLPEQVITTKTKNDSINAGLTTVVRVGVTDRYLNALQSIHAQTDKPGWLVVAIRPANPEGVQFIDNIEVDKSRNLLVVNGKDTLKLSDTADRYAFSHYGDGDVYRHFRDSQDQNSISCEVGMATAAALYRLEPGKKKEVSVTVPLKEITGDAGSMRPVYEVWSDRLAGTVECSIPDERLQFLTQAAIQNVLLHSSDEVVPGPYTYKRFWFRDASLIISALVRMGMHDTAQRHLEKFPSRQRRDGYFLSQEGEWDSNGQVLWVYDVFEKISGRQLSGDVVDSVIKGVEFLDKKRLVQPLKDRLKGLLPAGFSAEHLGPNDYYYWDDYWAVGGLRGAADMLERHQRTSEAEKARRLAAEYEKAIGQSIALIPHEQTQGAIPAAPFRRMDAGAVGSMVADYPLQIYPANHPGVEATLEYLLAHCTQNGGFFQEMIHSGINAYLTLDLAQTLLRNGDPRYRDLIKSTAQLASPTGQWPEAIHPLTLGGCMGDGQHIWAAAEWYQMIRNLFVREEKNELIIGSGLFPEWLQAEQKLHLRNAPTYFGPVSIEISTSADEATIALTSDTRLKGHKVTFSLPGFSSETMTWEKDHHIHLKRLHS